MVSSESQSLLAAATQPKSRTDCGSAACMAPGGGGAGTCAAACARALAAAKAERDGEVVTDVVARVERLLVLVEQELRRAEEANRIAAVNGPQTGRARRRHQANGMRIARERKKLRACWAEVRELRRRIADGWGEEDSAADGGEAQREAPREEEKDERAGFSCLVM